MSERGPSSEEHLLDIRNLRVRLPLDEGILTAVDGVSLQIAPGRTLGLVGELGCGKTMTAQTIMRLSPRSAEISGSVLLRTPEGSIVDTAALPWDGPEIRRVRGGICAMVFQEPMTSFSPLHTIGNQIVEAILLHRTPDRREAAGIAVAMLDRAGLPDPAATFDKYPHHLSGGMRQRAMIAMALSCRPRLLIADEPTTALDVTVQAQVLRLMRELQSEFGMAILYISHDLGVIAQMADDVAVMYLGRIVERASAANLFRWPRHPYTQALLKAVPRLGKRSKERLEAIRGTVPSPMAPRAGCSFFNRCSVAIPGLCDRHGPSLVDVAPAHGAACFHYPAVLAAAGLDASAALAEGIRDVTDEPILSLRDVRKDFPIEKGLLRRVTGHIRAVDGVDLDVGRGEILALVGESGSGKTTLGRCAIRAIEATSGTISLRTRSGEVVDLAAASRRTLRRLRSEMNMVFQDPFSSLSPRMPVRDIIAEPLRAQGTGRDEVASRVAEIAGLVGLDPANPNRYPNAFSGGQRQRIGLARALVTHPRLIVADEPVSALDVSIQAQILNLLLDLQERLSLSILFVSHDLSVVEHMADRVAVMYLGRIVELATTETLFSRPRHPYTEALLSAVPKIDPGVRDQSIILPGEIASNANPPSGCAFHPRCRYARAVCQEERPPLREVSPNLHAACHFADQLSLEGVGPE